MGFVEVEDVAGEEGAAAVAAELAEAEKRLPAEFRAEYDRVVHSRGEHALAQIEDDCCSGCNRRITPNMISKLMMDHVVCCTTCGCILYFQPK